MSNCNEFKTRLALADARKRGSSEDRNRRNLEAAIAFAPKKFISPYEKFKSIKPTGHSDGFGIVR